MENPFENAVSLSSDSVMIDRLLRASSMWESFTSDEKNISDEDLYTILIACDLMEIFPMYEIYKNGNGFDYSALNEAIQDWSISKFFT